MTDTTFFDGVTYDPALDKEPLKKQLGRVFEFMKDGEWHLLTRIHSACGGSEAGISARLRDLRKPRFGGHTVLRKRMGGRVYWYKLEVNNVQSK